MAQVSVSTTRSKRMDEEESRAYWKLEISARQDEAPEPLLEEALKRVQAARGAMLEELNS